MPHATSSESIRETEMYRERHVPFQKEDGSGEMHGRYIDLIHGQSMSVCHP